MRKKIITDYARMWPRQVFDMKDGKKLLAKGDDFEVLEKPGVYILYRDEHPFYVGQATRSLFSRLHAHANMATDRYFHFWNYFSVFVVPDINHIAEIEGILIASMPTFNSATPRIKEIRLPTGVARRLKDLRHKGVAL